MNKYAVLSLALCAALVACKKHGAAPEAVTASASVASTSASSTPATTEPAKTAEFDINSVPMSTVALGEFPFIKLPEGYSDEHFGKTKKTFARFPFWLVDKEHWVEGKFFGTFFDAAKGHQFSELEVRKNFDSIVQQMGGVKVSEGQIPEAITNAWDPEISSGFNDGLGDVYNNPATTYLVRRPEGNIWIHLTMSSSQGSYLVGQEKAFQQTAVLLPASELKKQIDASGKVALQVNFATDKTDILPDSQPQIEQVVQLMKDDPALQLAVNGHTDNSGDQTHNLALSEGRAKSVVAALVAKGVDAGRLSAKGFGDSQPVADNATANGKAKNRRVELVKR